MNTNDLNRAAMTVRKTEVIRLGAARGQRIGSVLARLWVTTDGDPRDSVLGTGEGFSIDLDEDVLVSALHIDARFVLPGEAAAA